MSLNALSNLRSTKNIFRYLGSLWLHNSTVESSAVQTKGSNSLRRKVNFGKVNFAMFFRLIRSKKKLRGRFLGISVPFEGRPSPLKDSAKGPTPGRGLMCTADLVLHSRKAWKSVQTLTQPSECSHRIHSNFHLRQPIKPPVCPHTVRAENPRDLLHPTVEPTGAPYRFCGLQHLPKCRADRIVWKAGRRAKHTEPSPPALLGVNGAPCLIPSGSSLFQLALPPPAGLWPELFVNRLSLPIAALPLSWQSPPADLGLAPSPVSFFLAI